MSGWSQAQVDARFYALVADLAGAPQEIIDPATGQVEGRVAQSLYGKRTWAGGVSSPLLFAGQYEDVESGWVYNRFRFYQPLLGSYNAQDPLGLAPRVASGQGYVDHAALLVDVHGLMAHNALSSKNVGRAKFVQNRINGIKDQVLRDWNGGSWGAATGEGGKRLSAGQLDNIRDQYWPRQMHRGTSIDQELKRRVRNDKILTELGVESTPQGASGPDFKLTLYEDSGPVDMWYDLTTDKAWSYHYKKYGPVPGLAEHAHQLLYRDGGYSKNDLFGKVAPL